MKTKFKKTRLINSGIYDLLDAYAYLQNLHNFNYTIFRAVKLLFWVKMLRVQTSILHQAIRHESGQLNTSHAGGGLGKKLFGLTLATGVATAGTVGYAYKDPEFRHTIEGFVPQTKELFKAVLGSSQ